MASRRAGAQLRAVDTHRPPVRGTRTARASRCTPTRTQPPAELNGTGHAALERYAADLAAGMLPSVRRIRREMHLGQPRAQQVQAYLADLART